jgi:virginiamycin B lyase
VLGPDGNLWFTDLGASVIGRLTPQGRFRSFPLPTTEWGLYSTPGPDGNLWFTELRGASRTTPGPVARITTKGVVTEFRLPGKGTGGLCITTGPDGNLWFTQASGSAPSMRIGRITPQGGITEFTL